MGTMKTIKEWVKELPAETREKFMVNMKNPECNVYAVKEEAEVDSLWQAVGGGFMWDLSPEGLNFWSNIHQQITLPKTEDDAKI